MKTGFLYRVHGPDASLSVLSSLASYDLEAAVLGFPTTGAILTATVSANSDC